ncbi:VOC family protein [Streptomyces finlayi]|uniref:VOC family protein n=1 Tax=Streptomyces finlayi TaxID=67296 RepID=UPI002156046D|nr:VOC family protein [Streptomyces finlayi]
MATQPDPGHLGAVGGGDGRGCSVRDRPGAFPAGSGHGVAGECRFEQTEGVGASSPRTAAISGVGAAHTSGLILAFTLTGIEDEEKRLRAEGVAITVPPREEPWGERPFQVTDPNGVIIQFVERATPADA